jgi:hypothetical protein
MVDMKRNNVHNNLHGQLPENPVEFLFWHIFLGQTILYAYEKNLFAFLHLCREQGTLATLATMTQHLNLSRRGTQAVLSTCCALKLVEKDHDAFKLTVLAETYLLKESPLWYGGVLEDFIENNFITSLTTLRTAFETDQPQICEGDHFKTANHIPKIASNFLKLMHSKSSAPASVWPSMLDLTNVHTMLDIGGGAGTHSIYASLHWPHLKAILFDLEFACRGATKFIANLELEHQITTMAKDMWTDPFPPADVHFYSDILHDWPLDRGKFLMRKSYAALPMGGRIMIHERLFTEDKSGPLSTAAYNVMMMLWTEGQQLSQGELVDILTEAGFRNVETQHTLGDWSITIGYKI